MSGTDEKLTVPEPDEKDFVYKSMDRVFRSNQGGFYFLIASPRTQASALARYAGGNVAVYDFGQARDEEQGRHIVQVLRLTEREPDRDVYVYQNFQLALWDSTARDGVGDWDVEAMRRLNYSRDQLNHLRKRMVFCMTREADDQLNRHAMDFYDFVQLFLRMEDEPEEQDERPAVVRPVDRSVGVDVKVDFSKSEEELLNQAIALGNQAYELREAARYSDAIHLYEKQLEIRREVLGTQDPDTADVYHGMGSVYDALAEYNKALEQHEKGLEILEKRLGPNHPKIAVFYNDIGFMHYRMGEFNKSIKMYERVLEVYKDNGISDGPDIAKTFHHLGWSCNELGQFNQAQYWFQKALKIREKYCGPESKEAASIYNSLGWNSFRMGNYSDALFLFKKALAVREKVYGPNNPVTARTYSTLGAVFDAMGDYNQSSKWLTKAVEIFSKTFGPNHKDTAHCYRNLGNMYKHLNNYTVALKYHQDALMAYEQLLGKNHPYTIQEYMNIADTYEHMGDTTTAALWRKKAEAAQNARDAETPAPPPDTDD